MNDGITKISGDGLSVALIGGTLLGYLPQIAAALSIIWALIRLYETCTVQRLIHRSKCKYHGEE